MQRERENKAVLLGFGLVAFVMIAVVAYGWLAMAKVAHPMNAHMNDPLSKAFDAAPFAGGGFRQVPEVETLLPLGMPAAEAIGKLTAEDFKCSRKPRAMTCSRSVAYPSADDQWKVTMTFDASDRLLSRSAIHAGTSL